MKDGAEARGSCSLEHWPAERIACSNGLSWLNQACRGGIKAMKIDSSAAYIGTVMNALIDLSADLVLCFAFAANVLNLDLGWDWRRRSDIGEASEGLMLSAQNLD